jgi:adenine-specific DNA-methyltransferase
MTKQSNVKIAEAKGRPMLHWVGKRPLDHVTAFPAQLVERFDPVADPANPAGEGGEGGLLFHGDNKDVLAWLLAHGYRGKVGLVYIDPPFDSGADYVRKVQLRGVKGSGTLLTEPYSLDEQVQYTDIWANDTYLQFMYERLILLKELLTPSGSLFLHCDWHKVHHLRCLADEVFGAENFQNEVVWQRTDPHNDAVNRYGRIHDTILWYGMTDRPVYNYLDVVKPLSEAALREYSLVELPNGEIVPHSEEWDGMGRRFKLDDCTWKGTDAERQFEWRGARPSNKRVWPYDLEGMEAALAKGEFYLRDPNQGAARCRKSYLDERPGQLLQDIWINVGRMKGGVDYPTQKPETLLERIIKSSSNPGDLVLDCFCGSGTTPAVAQKLGRRWIAADINKGAIQTTSKRLQTVIQEQRAAASEPRQATLDLADEDAPPRPASLAFSVYRVNDYDLHIQHNEAVALAVEHIGIERMKTDPYFDGTLGRKLVKIVPFNHPLTPLDLQTLKDELETRKTEDRDVVIVCLGKETAVDPWLEEYNRHRPVNNISLIELRTDQKYGKFLVHQPAQAQVDIRRAGDTLVVAIKDFLSPTIVERLEMDMPLFKATITDWRAMVDCVMIDTAYDGDVFDIDLSDVPERKDDLVEGRYELEAPEGETTVAVKIIDMLGEEVLVTETV